MTIESPKATVQKSQKELFEFLTDVKNFEKLMPESITKFEMLNEKRFLFALSGMPEIVLELKDQTAYNQVVLGAASDKLPFTLTANIESISETESTCILLFEGQFNPMMGMMIKSPITNFVGTLVTNMSKL
ncbi:hypothetical protein SAMN05216480_11095 [Pustulibacterium marinum]|uniref:Carbon monoxide dehydrogenase subunit G n=1 Tax=Pustulibacterium marinum TaxID=1224947 RepID=A0A1I7HPF8_9FLAO|nr:orotate phosphoribosyltransferase [Pustulibacterium marinum]SFU62531.1 hypothetical protein SAMN05216480_11095 [Pustulibacterium marinum]